MTTGVGLARARSSRQTSKPFFRGSVMSRITRSDVIDDREAETGPLRARSGVGLDAEEFAEDLPLHARRDADAVVADPDEAVAVGARHFDFDVAAFRRVLHRVRHEVLDRLHRRLGV